MSQLTGHRANAASLADEFGVAFHWNDVRLLRTLVNVEKVPMFDESADMAGGGTIGDQLRRLQERAGLSYDAIAKKAGYNGRSSVQRYFAPEFDPEFLPLRVANRLVKGFEGTSVGPAEIMALAGLPEANARVVRYEGASDVVLPRDIPIYGTSLGAPRDFEGKAIEQTMLNSGETLGYLPRPTVLNGVSNAYGLYVQGSSMSPRFEDGETVFVTHSKHSRPPRIGDDVVVYLRDVEMDDEDRAAAVLIKRLVRRTAHYTELEQFNPPLTFKIEADKIVRIDRVIPWAELLS